MGEGGGVISTPTPRANTRLKYQDENRVNKVNIWYSESKTWNGEQYQVGNNW